ncbi:hypothetical protein SNK04_014080 [Fusarium graminearum]
MVNAMNRTKDDVVIAALGGNSRSTTSTIALPASQKIAVNATGLSKAKIIQAKTIFRRNEADAIGGEELFMAYSARPLPTFWPTPS